MVLEAKLFEKKQSIRKNENPIVAAPKSDKHGDVKKCPSCGSMVQSFSTRCQDCGHDFKNIETNSSIQKLFELLNAAENNRSGGTSSMFGKLQSVFGVTDVDKRKIELISSFPIPTTKDDMLEFLSLALPKTKLSKTLGFLEADKDKIPNMYARTWKQKCEQIVMKAKFSMKDDKKALEEIMQYANELGIK